MKKETKENIYRKAKNRLDKTRSNIIWAINSTKNLLQANVEESKEGRSQDRVILSNLVKQNKQRLEELGNLKTSPYFFRCEVEITNGKREVWHFSKFNFSEESIFSWVSAAAAIRFEEPGKFSYKRPTGETREGVLLRKDQYMIVDGEIVFLATESIDTPRELIYQKHFSVKKDGFVLPEIVAQMEKAQDKVIRATHAGPFIISGPAGSGKTTLALHRVAYLTQSPDTMNLYPTESILVLVQDVGTKKYFKQLLPDLGINNVAIKTFAEWAMGVLDVKDIKYAMRLGKTENEKDSYEYEKLNILRNNKNEIPKYEKNIYKLLDGLYEKYLSEENFKIFREQEKNKTLDKFDITILLMSYVKKFGAIRELKTSYRELKNGDFKKEIKNVPIQFSLIVIDEFQNYLPAQLALLKMCSRKKYQSVVYVGEVAQQIQLGTIQNLSDIGEDVKEDRIVTLSKVYRNTKNILTYIKSIGYDIEISKDSRGGKAVIEKVLLTKIEEIGYIKNVLKTIPKKSILGIISRDSGYLLKFKREFKKNDQIRVFNIYESQGVEFDVVCLVGVDRDMILSGLNNKPCNNPIEIEKQKIKKHLLYLALTRAISELHVLGKVKLSDELKEDRSI